MRGNQNARKHGLYSRLISAEDLEFLDLPPEDQLSVLMSVATARALKAHQLSADKPDSDRLGEEFSRQVRAATLIADKLVLLKRQGQATGAASPTDPDEKTCENERRNRLADIIGRLRGGGPDQSAGSSPVESGQPAPD